MPRISGSSTVEGVLIDWSLDQPVELPGLPVALLSKEQAAAELQRRQRRQAMDAAYEAELILRLAELHPRRRRSARRAPRGPDAGLAAPGGTWPG